MSLKTNPRGNGIIGDACVFTSDEFREKPDVVDAPPLFNSRNDKIPGV